MPFSVVLMIGMHFFIFNCLFDDSIVCITIVFSLINRDLFGAWSSLKMASISSHLLLVKDMLLCGG